MAVQHPAPTPQPADRVRKRGEGQWALGHREPLNPNERIKKDDDGLNVRARIENIYAKPRLRLASTRPTCAAGCAGGASTPSASPASTAARPRSWSREELDDEYFMLRVRIDGGQLNLEQLRAIAEISQRVTAATPPTSPTGRTSSCTGSGSRTCPTIWRAPRGGRPAAPPRPAATRPRVILGSPGRRHRRRRDHRRHAGDRRDRRRATSATRSSPTCRASSRPRSPARRCQDVAHEINDISFVGVVHPEHGPGFDLWVGGGLSTNPMLAQRLGAWVPLDEVPDVWAGVVGDLPRLRLPPAAHPRPAEVPGRRLGRRRSSARCWRTSTSAAR